MWLENSVSAMPCEISSPEHHQTFNILLWGAISSYFFSFFFFLAFQSIKRFFEDLALTVLGSNLVLGSMEYRVGVNMMTKQGPEKK